LRETEDVVEGIGISRARERAEAADLRVFLLDETGQAEGLQPQPEDIVLRGKGDLTGGGAETISGKTGQGVAHLISRLTSVLETRAARAQTATRERHRVAIVRALTSLEVARNQVERGEGSAELAAEELRMAIRALDSLVGRVDVEQILDEIFASFCLGK
ncbi:MAG: tRNA uridine-5-carboxymethylaminomethyl(34) synthesis GTPase MnmE, partial [Paracoccaceae bacterium]